jgi:hypothetical protein
MLPYLVSKPNTVIDPNDSHSKLQSAKVSNKSGVKEESYEMLGYLNASKTLFKLPKMMLNTNTSNQYEMRRVNL